jgi:hypothetical protein
LVTLNKRHLGTLLVRFGALRAILSIFCVFCKANHIVLSHFTNIIGGKQPVHYGKRAIVSVVNARSDLRLSAVVFGILKGAQL